jgi:outer membrane protein TolC
LNQNNGVLFGARGIHAALSDFDPRLITSSNWGRDENTQNNAFLSGGIPAGGTLIDNNAQYQARLEQQLLTGGTFAVNQNWNYSQNNQPSRLFQSAYTGSLGAEYRQPLWSGAGREFNAIAGPSSQRARGFSYVNQGVVIAQINSRISQIDFEENLQNLAREIGDLYWDLHQAWQEYVAEQSTAEASLKLWVEVQAKFQSDLVGGAEEAQAEDTYHEAVARRDIALSTFFQTEARMRRLLGLPIDDGQVLFPSDIPLETEAALDRTACLFEAYVNRLELRRQKTNIQSLELQLSAARNLAHPRLDFVAGYRLNGFGDDLIASHNADGVTSEGFNSAYGALFRGNQTSWDLGVEYSIPLWMRSERAQVRQLELRLLKARKGLAAQEDEIAHELNAVFQTMQRWLRSAQTNKQRYLAANRRVEAASSEYHDAGRTGVDPLLRAEISLTQAQVSYHRSVAEYNKALRDLLYRTGRLLYEDGINLLGVDGQPVSTPSARWPSSTHTPSEDDE